jgi:hypothetical protein
MNPHSSIWCLIRGHRIGLISNKAPWFGRCTRCDKELIWARRLPDSAPRWWPRDAPAIQQALLDFAWVHEGLEDALRQCLQCGCAEATMRNHFGERVCNACESLHPKTFDSPSSAWKPL